MTAELWLHRPCVHGHEGSFRTHPPVAEMLRGDELPCEGGRPRVRLDPDRELVVPDDWARPAHITVQDILDALTEQETDGE